MRFPFAIFLVSFLFAANQSDAYTLTCGSSVTLTLDAADLVNLGTTNAARRFVVAQTQVLFGAFNPTDTCSIDQADSITFMASECFPSITRGANFAFTWTLWKVVADTDFPESIARYIDSSLAFTCNFPLETEISVSIQPTIRSTAFVTQASGTFTITGGLCNDDFTIPLGTNLITVPDYVNIQITLEGVGPSLRIRGKNCWVDKSVELNTTSTPRYNIITNYCESTPLTGETINVERQVVKNEVDEEFQIRFNTFVFADDLHPTTQYYVHCQVEVCDNDGGDCLATGGCKKRKRRSVVSELPTEAEVHHVTVGPIQFIPVDHCDNKNGGCEEVCVIDKDELGQCYCGKGETLASNGKDCIENEVLQGDTVVEIDPRSNSNILHNQTSSITAIYYIAGMAALCFTMLVVAIVLFINSNRGSYRFST